MTHFDVCNGDADGLCALHQLRLAQPIDAQLITGVKRDNTLLKRVAAARGDSVTVCDIALAQNLDPVRALLERGVHVEYFDHHHAPEVPSHPLFNAFIDTAPDVCTSMLVDRHLNGRNRAWAVVGAYGDNLAAGAAALGAELAMGAAGPARLRQLGESINYNSYGERLSDLLIAPAELYRLMQPYADPLQFIRREEICAHLARRYAEDLRQALAVLPRLDTAMASVVMLPDADWARRVGGSLANRLAGDDPLRAHAVLVPDSRGTYLASLRTPAGRAHSADAFARRFGGDGRRTAAGVDDLQQSDVPRFIEEFARDMAAA
jgi:hypothetical protein